MLDTWRGNQGPAAARGKHDQLDLTRLGIKHMHREKDGHKGKRWSKRDHGGLATALE